MINPILGDIVQLRTPLRAYEGCWEAAGPLAHATAINASVGSNFDMVPPIFYRSRAVHNGCYDFKITGFTISYSTTIILQQLVTFLSHRRKSSKRPPAWMSSTVPRVHDRVAPQRIPD